MTKTLELQIDSDDQKGLKDFVKVFNQAQSNQTVEHTVRLTFQNLESLLKALTPKRFELLKTLAKEAEGISIRRLSKLLKRDYKNVHNDVSQLDLIGLIAKKEDTGLIYTPYESLDAHFNLAA